MDLEGQVKEWTPEQRQLAFPTTVGRIIHYGQFLENVWQPLLAKAGLPYRKYHSTRHTCATWLSSDGADLRADADGPRLAFQLALRSGTCGRAAAHPRRSQASYDWPHSQVHSARAPKS